MTISLECRKVKGKQLLIKFVFESHTDALDHGHVCYSVDKYMSLDIWTRLYEKLSKPMERYVRNPMKMPAKETIQMHRAQLDLVVSWKKVDEMHSGVCDTVTHEMYPYFMVVEVHTVTRVNDFVRKLSKFKAESNGRNDSMENESAPEATRVQQNVPIAGDSGARNACMSKRTHEEYVPEKWTAVPDLFNLSYTPSKNGGTSVDEYTPTKMVKVEGGTEARGTIGDDHHYFPSPINNNNYKEHSTSKPYSRGQIKSPRPNKVRATTSRAAATETVGIKRSAETMLLDKGNLSTDLFGDSSGSDAEVKALVARVTTRAPPERKAKLVAQKSIGPSKASTSSATSGKASSSATSSHPIKKVVKKEKSVEKPVEKPTNEQEYEMINEIIRQKIESNTLTDACGNQVGLTRLIDLKDMSVEEVVNSFDDYAAEMQKMFDVKRWESRLRPSKEFCYLAVTQTLLTEDQMKAMVDTLTEKLTNPEEHGPIPFHHLFWEFMLPEWALLILMTRYNMTRTEALKQVRRHDIAYALNAPDNFDRI